MTQLAWKNCIKGKNWIFQGGEKEDGGEWTCNRWIVRSSFWVCSLWLLHERRRSLKCSIVSLGIVTTTFLFSCHRLPTKFPAVTNNTPKTSCRVKKLCRYSRYQFWACKLRTNNQGNLRETQLQFQALAHTQFSYIYIYISFSQRGFYSANPRETQLQFQAIAHTQFSKNLSPSLSVLFKGIQDLALDLLFFVGPLPLHKKGISLRSTSWFVTLEVACTS